MERDERSIASNDARRTPPDDMPREAPRPAREVLRGHEKPKDDLPKQRSLTEAEEKKAPSKLRRILARVGLGLLLIAALAFIYVFLLLGEPVHEEGDEPSASEESLITTPMNALEIPEAANVESLADAFGQPVLSLYGGLEMQKARIFDTAFGGGFARRVTLTYAFEDGSLLTVESIRPTAAVTLLDEGGYHLNAGALYTLGGVNAARIENGEQIRIFGQSDTAVYAVTCPAAHEEELTSLLRLTTLIRPSETEE